MRSERAGRARTVSTIANCESTPRHTTMKKKLTEKNCAPGILASAEG